MIISAVIPTRNRAAILSKNIEVLERFGVNEIIVVDGASEDATPAVVKRLQKLYGNIVYIRSQSREGLPRARNKGIENAKGDVILMLDDDAIIENKHGLDAIKEDFKLNKRVGIVGGLITEVLKPRIDPPFQIRKASFLSSITGMVFLRNGGDQAHITNYVARAIAIRREVTTNLRYDVGYEGSAYREDSDFQLTAREHGWLILFDPRFKVLHYGQNSGGCRGQTLAERMYWKARNHAYFLFKHFSSIKLLWYLLISLLILAVYKPTCIKYVFRGMRDGITSRILIDRACEREEGQEA